MDTGHYYAAAGTVQKGNAPPEQTDEDEGKSLGDMKFSIIIPAYNEEKNLERCIDSILMQSFQDYEIIIVDDGSTDGTREAAYLCAGRNQKIKVLFHENNRGLGAARNTGMRSARGEYLLFVDADDYIAEGALDNISKTGGEHVILLTSCKIRHGRVQEEFRRFEEEDFDGNVEQVIPRLVEKNIFIGSACEKAVKREWALEHEIFFPENRLKETVSWCVKVLIHTESISFCNADYYCYVQQGRESLSGRINQRSVSDTLLSIEESVERIQTCCGQTWRKQACLLFLCGPMLFSAEYMENFGTREMKITEKKFLYLLSYSKDAVCKETWWILSILGIEFGSKVVCWRSKRRFARKRTQITMGE